jgi:carboxyl-terminal processing protease
MNQNRKYDVWQPFLLAGMVVIGILIGVKMNTGTLDFVEKVSLGNAAGPIGRVEEVVRFIESKYVDSLDSDQILEAAIADIMDDLDPHSIYLSARQLKSLDEQMNGYYRGVGVESFFIDDTLRISRVIKDSPAELSGIMPFDQLITIGDSTIAGVNKPYSEIRELLRADGQDKLKLGIKRRNNTSIIEAIVIPGEINLQSSKVAYSMEDNIAYIKVDRFSSNTYKEFMESLEVLIEKDSTRHLIIDLRDNPGGYLPETVNILSQLFNEKGRLLVYTQGKSEKKVEYKTTGKNFFPVDKIAVLIDEGSASGSEIIAGAIQDWDRGLVIGRRSFGKGLVQEQYPLRNGGAIRLTISRYYTPSGRSIQKSYEDLDEYGNELYERYHNGEVYGNGYQEKEDSLVFFTKLLNRKVYGGGGIYPDVFVPADSTISIQDQSQVYSYIPEFVFLERTKGEGQDFNTDDFFSFLVTRGLEKINDLKLNNDDILKSLKAEYAYQTIGEIARDSILNDNDPYILEAIKYLHSNTSLKEYTEKVSTRSEEN